MGPVTPPPLFLGRSSEWPCSLPLVQASASAPSIPVLHPDSLQGAWGQREARGEKGPHAGLPDQGGENELLVAQPGLVTCPASTDPTLLRDTGTDQVGHGIVLSPAGLTSACTPMPPTWGASGRLPQELLEARVETMQTMAQPPTPVSRVLLSQLI